MTLPQFIAWMSVAYFTGMLTTGLIGLAYTFYLKTAEEVDEVCDCGGGDEAG